MLKKEMEEINKAKVERVKRLHECTEEFANGLKRQSLDIESFMERVSLSEEQFKLMKE